jgi:hypothetical protein
LEIATSPVAADAHGNGGSAAATLANVLGPKEYVVGSVGSGARAAQGAAGSKVREDLTEVGAGRGNQAPNAFGENSNGTVALMGLVREGRRVVGQVLEPGSRRRRRASVGKKAQEVTMKTASRCVVRARVSRACQKFLVAVNVERSD